MKFGVRPPSPKRMIKARTTGRIKRAAKRAVNPLYGKKGVGFVRNPKRAVYNKIYRKTSVGVGDVARHMVAGSSATSRSAPGRQSLGIHILLLLTTAGIGNVVYALVKSAQRRSG